MWIRSGEIKMGIKGGTKALLLIFDFVASILAFFAAYYLRNFGPFRLLLDSVQPLSVYLKALPFAVLLLVFLFYCFGLYKPKQRISKISEFYTVNKAITFWLLLIMAGSYLVKYDYSRLIVLLYFIFSLVFVNMGRYLVMELQKKLFQKGLGVSRILIVGAGRVGREVARRLREYEKVGYQVVGFVDGKVRQKGSRNILGDFSDLDRLIESYQIDEVYIADPTLAHYRILNTLAQINANQVKFKLVSNIFDLATGSVEIHQIEEIPSLDLSRLSPTLPQRLVKRAFDLCLSLLLLLSTLPLWVFISLLIKLDSPGPIILRQKRIGYKLKPFGMYKFRTMFICANPRQGPSKTINDPRITRVGKIFRKASLDELPQLINVIKGEMSLVGPRPELPHKIKAFEPWQKKRFEVLPGLTGLWQILGRKDLPLSENIEYDFYYINNQSLFLDLIIILKTIPVVLFGKGAY